MITKDSVIEAYMINDKQVIAEMLYDTITMYEERTCKSCKYRQASDRLDINWCILQDGANKYREMDIRVDLDFGCNKYEPKI